MPRDDDDILEIVTNRYSRVNPAHQLLLHYASLVIWQLKHNIENITVPASGISGNMKLPH